MLLQPLGEIMTILTPYHSEILPGTYPLEMGTHTKNMYKKTHVSIILNIHKLEITKHPSTVEWISKIVYCHRTDKAMAMSKT